VQLPRPKGDVVHYAQGARFAVARERILQRPKAFYERLLQAVATEEDPCLNYLYEIAWFYIMGRPESSACEVSEADVRGIHSVARRLSGGVSGGVSGGSSGGDGSSDDSGATKAPGNVDGAPSQRAAGPVLVAGMALAAAGSLL
jgi:hypothetical protein